MTLRVLAGRGRVAAVTGSVLVAIAGGCSQPGDEGPGRPGPTAQESGGGSTGPARPAAPPGDTPLAGATFYVDPSTPAATQAARWDATGRADDARQLDKIGGRPIAHWLTGGEPDAVRAEADDYVGRAAAAGQLPLLVAYHIPNRDCGSYSAGGAPSAEHYRAWIRAVAAGIGDRPVAVVLEPDAVAQTLAECRGVSAERYALLSDAVTVLKKAARTHVYVDAGNPTWVRDVGALAGGLRQAGVPRADGFALNVSNFVTTKDNLSYGNWLSDALDGAHFVIDTSRNGNGPWPDGTEVNGAPAWCNPPGRVLGAAPTTGAGMPRVDALLWVKRPGDSDGACRPGEPAAGEWWPEYALDMARRSS